MNHYCLVVVLNLSGARNQFHGKKWGKGNGFRMIILYLLCTLLLLLLHHLQFRSSGIRTWRFGTLCLQYYCLYDPKIIAGNSGIARNKDNRSVLSQLPSTLGTLQMGYCCSASQSCQTLCYLMDHRPPGSSVHGILQARILEEVAISFSRGSS